MQWSDAVNASIAAMVRNVPPFPHVRQSLTKLAAVADIMVVSATPNEALQNEWNEHGIAAGVRMICGQEMGSKAEHIKYGAVAKYDSANILMVGDAPGDMKSAKVNGALFYPIMPGNEAASWRRFLDEGIDRFLAGRFAGPYEQTLIDEFLALLPSVPPWKS